MTLDDFLNSSSIRLIMAFIKKALKLGLLVLVFTFLVNVDFVDAGTATATLQRPNSLFVSGNYLYVASGGSSTQNSLEILDISNPDVPVHVSNLLSGEGGAVIYEPSSLFVEGNYAYITSPSAQAMEIVDVSDRSNPVHLTTISSQNMGGFARPHSVMVRGNYAYVLTGNSTIFVLDVSDPANPVQVGQYFTASILQPKTMTISGNYLYVGWYCTCNGDGEVRVFDISDPTTPILKTNIPWAGNSSSFVAPNALGAVGNKLYVLWQASGGNVFETIDISDPLAPVRKGRMQNGDDGAALLSPRGIVTSGNYVFTVDASLEALEIIDVSDDNTPKHKGKLVNGDGGESLSGPFSVEILGNNAYVASYTGNAIHVIDISDPANPKHKSKILDGEVTATLTPQQTGCVVDCNSNVLFLPGLEASRLYQKSSGGSENQLWEPNRNLDVEKLYLNTDGNPINSDIYTKDIIKETNSPISTGFAGQNIYKSFSNTMDQLVIDQKIDAWGAYPYDWRQGVDDIVNNGTVYQHGRVLLTDALQTLVNLSTKNGKVTIVAHSNGGLLAKAFLKKLQADKIAGLNDLIDHVDVLILVAVPEIGTASAVPTVLHGYNQRIGIGFMMDEVNARELGRNMPSAYGLLPSQEYINRVSASPVTFVSNSVEPVTANLTSTYGSAINSYAEYKDFLLGKEGRTISSKYQTNLPIPLSSNILSKAESLHSSIDAWVPPSTLRVIEVAGWGLDTIASFEYYPQLCYQTLNCGFTVDERPRFTSDGDGTVVVPSAQYMSVDGNAEKYWVDLPRYNRFFNFTIDRKHKDILEIDSLNNLIQAVIKRQDIVLGSVLKNEIPIDTSNHLRLSIHSPVTLDAYDVNGNHTGKICPAGSDFCYAEENIPNSAYLEFGEGKYINLPEDEANSIKLQGTDVGTFTYNSEQVLPNGTSVTSSFIDIPVTTQTQGEVVLSAGVPQLKLDVTGDGINDFTLTPNATFDPITYLQIMRATIDSLDLPLARIKAFDKRVDNIIKSIQKDKIEKAKLKADRFKNVLEKKLAKPDPKHPKPKKLTKTDAQLLLDMLNKLLDNLG